MLRDSLGIQIIHNQIMTGPTCTFRHCEDLISNMKGQKKFKDFTFSSCLCLPVLTDKDAKIKERIVLGSEFSRYFFDDCGHGTHAIHSPWWCMNLKHQRGTCRDGEPFRNDRMFLFLSKMEDWVWICSEKEEKQTAFNWFYKHRCFKNQTLHCHCMRLLRSTANLRSVL